MPVSPIPRGVYPSVTALDPKALRARGITLVLADLDNTLVPYGVTEPPEEIVAKEGFCDTVACRTPGAVELFAPVRPASLSNDEADAQAIRAEIERAALEVCRAYQVRDLARVDLVWDGAQARVLEVDVSPSLAESSPFSLACEASGLSLSGVLNELVSQYAR